MPRLRPRKSLRKGDWKHKRLHKAARWHRTMLRRLIDAHGGACAYCLTMVTLDDAGTAATIDHLMPVSKGGTDDMSNLRLACRRCNEEKADAIGLDITTG